MTTLNTIIEEEKQHKNVDLLKRYIREAYPQGDALIGLVDDILTTAMQRAYEAGEKKGREVERERILNILGNLVPKDEDAMDVINDWIIPELKRAIHSELDQDKTTQP